MIVMRVICGLVISKNAALWPKCAAAASYPDTARGRPLEPCMRRAFRPPVRPISVPASAERTSTILHAETIFADDLDVASEATRLPSQLSRPPVLAPLR